MMPKTNSPRNSISFPDEEMDENLQPTGIVPTDKDVLLGRGRTNFYHKGNVRFREIVGSTLEAYLCAASRSEKSKIVRAIADEVLAGDSRFLKQDEKTFDWHDAGIKAAREKVGHALRDASSDKSRSIKNIHLNLLRKKKANTKNKKRNNQTTHLSVIEATRISLSETPDSTLSNTDATKVQTSLHSCGDPMDSFMNEAGPPDFDLLSMDPAANEFALPLQQADRIFSDELYHDIQNFDRSPSPDSSCNSLDDYLEVVNEIELEDLEAYLAHALDCAQTESV